MCCMGRAAGLGASTGICVGWVGLHCSPLGDSMVADALRCAYDPTWAVGGGMMSLRRHPISHSVGVVPVRSQTKRALCNESIWSLEMYSMGSVFG